MRFISSNSMKGFLQSNGCICVKRRLITLFIDFNWKFKQITPNWIRTPWNIHYAIDFTQKVIDYSSDDWVKSHLFGENTHRFVREQVDGWGVVVRVIELFLWLAWEYWANRIQSLNEWRSWLERTLRKQLFSVAEKLLTNPIESQRIFIGLHRNKLKYSLVLNYIGIIEFKNSVIKSAFEMKLWFAECSFSQQKIMAIFQLEIPIKN